MKQPGKTAAVPRGQKRLETSLNPERKHPSSNSGVPEVAELDGSFQVLESGLSAGVDRKGHSAVAVVGVLSIVVVVVAALLPAKSARETRRTARSGEEEQVEGSGESDVVSNEASLAGFRTNQTSTLQWLP